MKHLFIAALIMANYCGVDAQINKFERNFSPMATIVTPQEKPYRDEIFLSGYWQFQPIDVPKDWVYGKGNPPDLPLPSPDKYDKIPIKIPSPWNVNTWGGGRNTGEGSNKPYAPSSLYYPSYPQKWDNAEMGWLKRNFRIPDSWKDKRIVLHLDAVMGDCEILINGKKVTHHFEGYLPFDIDITDASKLDGDNELLVGVRARKLFDKTDSLYKYFHATYPPGSNTSDLVGIWQDVYLLAKPAIHISNVFVKSLVDKKTLTIDVQLDNATNKSQTVSLNGSVKKWINDIDKNNILEAPEIKSHLGNTVIDKISSKEIQLLPGKSTTITIDLPVNGQLEEWSPDDPNLYTLVLNVENKKKTIDIKTQRFGWRQFLIRGKDFFLNGKKIQCLADIQHPFGPYICSRRFGWAWFKMIKDFGGNAVRLHAQPWPEFYCDLADEMGLMVLDETALFGSSLGLNFEDTALWNRTNYEIDQLVLRDRNHPSVIGWSVGNELFAIAMYNKPSKTIADKWDKEIIKLAQRPQILDPTRQFVTVDGNEDMNGSLPVWSKHFGLGLHLNDLPKNYEKPIVIGESGGTYYAKPAELYQFTGQKVYENYYGRNTALAVDVYQNIVKMAKPFLSYFSPSEVSWFGIEHLNLGYHEFNRLPGNSDGIFPALPYKDGQAGYQFERIPPYVSTFNPGLDKSLPLYKPLPMFEGLQDALLNRKSKWSKSDTISVYKPLPKTLYDSISIAGNDTAIHSLMNQLSVNKKKINYSSKVMMINGESVTKNDLDQALPAIKNIQSSGGIIWIMLKTKEPTDALRKLFKFNGRMIIDSATALQSDSSNEIGSYFKYSDLYFSEMSGDNNIIKRSFLLETPGAYKPILKTAKTNWTLFNNEPENTKCARIILYEQMHKNGRTIMYSSPFGKGILIFSTLDYSIMNSRTKEFWRKLLGVLNIKSGALQNSIEETKKQGDLLKDGPPS